MISAQVICYPYWLSKMSSAIETVQVWTTFALVISHFQNHDYNVHDNTTVEVPSESMEEHRTGYLTSNVLTTSEEGTYFCRAYFETYTIESERATVSFVRKFNHHNFWLIGRSNFQCCNFVSNETFS